MTTVTQPTDIDAFSKLIRSRIHYHVVLRPRTFDKERVPLKELVNIVRQLSVLYRGWDYPHVDVRYAPVVSGHYVTQATEWEHHKEFWRVYQSGQFVSLGGGWMDWRDAGTLWPAPANWKPSQVFYVVDAIYTLTEIFEFAKRWALSPLGDDSFSLKVTVGHIKGSQLELAAPGRIPLIHRYSSNIDEFPQELSFSRQEFIGNPWERACEAADKLFQRFGWNPSPDLIRSLQAGINRP